MTFFLPAYLLFLLVSCTVYYLVKASYRIYVLFAASLFFIGALSLQVALVAFVFTCVNYFAGIILYKYKDHPVPRRRYFWLIIVFDVGLLSFFKYGSFLGEGFQYLFPVVADDTQGTSLSMLMPLGLSYYTFQSMGYLIRINRGSEKAENNFAVFAVYLLFFPKFLSGPVERSNHFFPQAGRLGPLSRQRVFESSSLFVWGVCKKVLIADPLSVPLFEVYDHIHSYTGLTLVRVLLFQTLYIYADFSGYTDMALGSAKLFGIDLIDNFKRPFLAKTVAEYWKRWHISLSSWCNDFIYNPFVVKYRKWGNLAVTTGLFLTFFIMGIWHGAHINFVILGLLQAVAIWYETKTKAYRVKVSRTLPMVFVNTISRVLVFLFMSFSMVFFFSHSLSDACYFTGHLFSGIQPGQAEPGLITDGGGFLVAILLFVILFVNEVFAEKGKTLISFFQKESYMKQWLLYIALGLLMYYSFPGATSFYYTRF